jgi:hypothetical protein
MSDAAHTNEKPANSPADCVEASACESQRQVVVDVLATAIVDLLLEKHACVREKYEARTC